MTFNRVSPVCLILCLTALASTATAQTPASPAYVGDSTGFATAGDFSGSYLFGNDGGTYFLFDKMVGDGPGFSAGYTRLGMRVKLIDHGDSHLWGSGYALITDENRVGINMGGGYRWLVDSNIISLHGWWDSYETDNGNRYDQVTAGVELLHEEVDLRINGYLPIGEEENFLGVTDPGIVSVFTSRGIGFLGRGLDEQALKGIDAEVGTAIFAVNWARVYAGGYYYESKDSDFGGVRGRIETAISPDLSFNFVVQNDTEFDTNYNVSVEYRFSGGLSPGFFTPFHGETRKYNPVRRQWPVATNIVEIDTTVPLLSRKTGLPVTAAFIDSRNPGAGDGSFENPFSTLPDSIDAEKIFVFTGDSSIGNPIAGNITLMPHQQLLGEGKLYTFQDDLRGTITVPDVFSPIGPRPVLTAENPAENIVTLSKGNRVANFDMIGPAAAAIGGMNIVGFEIDMVRTAGVTDGVNIMNASGRGIIRDSGFSSTDQGIFVSNTTGNRLVLSIERGATAPGIPVPTTALGGREGIHVAADGANIDLVMTDVLVNNTTETGIILDASLGGSLTADVDNAHVRNTGGVTGQGFALNVDSGGSMGVNMMDISAAGLSDLFVVDVHDGSFHGIVGGGVPGVVPGARFETSATGSGVRINLEDAFGHLRFENLASNGNAVNGIETDATGDGTNFLLEVIDSQVWGNGASGFSTDIIDGADFRYFVDPTFAMQNGGSGFEYDVRGPGSVFIADIIQTTFADSGLHAVDGNVFNGAFANVDLTQSPGTGAALNGYNLNVDRNSTFVGTIAQGEFSFAADAAVDLRVANNSSLRLTVNSLDAHDNGDVGLNYLVEGGVNGPSELFLAVNEGDFNTNPDSNIVGTVRGAGSRASVYFTQVTADGLGGNGSVVLNAESGGINNLTWTGGSVSQGFATGIDANVDGAGSQIRLNLNTLTIGTNAGDGINGTLTNGGPGSLLNLSLINSTVANNGLSGVVISADGAGALSNVIFDNTPVVGNFNGDGYRFEATGGAGIGAWAFGPATSFSGNGQQGWDGRVDGAGSVATLDVDGANADANGLHGGLFDVTDGGLFNLTLRNLSVSRNPLDGLLTTVDGMGSRANILMDQVTMNRNGLSLVGDGFEARASGGGLINATMTNMTVTENRESGFLYDASTGGMITTRMDAIIGDNNGRHGLQFNAESGGQFDAAVGGASFSNNGGPFVGNGVYGTASGAGTVAMAVLGGTVADNNNRMGFEFDVRSGATLLADIRSNVQFGNSSGSGNAINGVRFNATGAGTMGFLKMMGANTFDDNVAGDGINYDAVGVDMAVAQVTGTVNNNGADGINIRMINVTEGAISLQGAGPATISGNAGDGIDITTQNVALVTKTVNGMLIPDFQIDGFTITGNGGDPIVIDMTNTTFEDGEITNNTIDGGLDGINVHLGGGDGDLLIDGNVITGAQRYGIAVTSDAGVHKVTISNNQVVTSGDTNIFVDLFGTTETGLMINDNTLIGGGSATPTFTVGTNFTGATALTSPTPFVTPPDTNGGVGIDHIVEIINNGYAVYDKATGTQLFGSSLGQFWTDAGLPPRPAGTILTDPRIIFDPTVNRWFVVTIDADPFSIGTASNNILVAVSRTEDPLDGFIGLEFVADTIDANRLADYPTLGVDADGIYIGTNNFNPGFSDVAVYSIPKADLLLPVPTLANLTRFEASDPTIFGDTLQAAVDFGPSDGVTNLLSTDFFTGGANLVRTDIFGTAGPGAIISAPVDVSVQPYLPGPPGDQPSGALLDNVSPRFGSNIVKVGNSLWAAHAILGTNGNSIVRWYEIDATTNTVLQTGDITNPQLDFLDPSIAVNAQGVVVIGFTGTGPTQSASSMAVLGTTNNMGTTTFQTPQILQAGTGSYNTGGGFSRWGDYSATVVDPTDPNSFWTFQEFANGTIDFGIQITQLTFEQAVLGGTVNDGIHVNVREMARMTDSMINGNSATLHGDDGIEVVVTDTAAVDSLMIDGNATTENGDDGIRFETASPNELGALEITNNTSSDNVGDGIDVDINDLDPAMVPDVIVGGNLVEDNMGDGISVNIINSSVDDVVISANTVRGNLGEGIFLNMDNMTGGVINADAVMLAFNMVEQNSGDGAVVQLSNLTGLRRVDLQNNTITENAGRGLVLMSDTSPIQQVNVSDNAVVNNMQGDAVLIDLLDSPVDVMTIVRNQVGGAPDDGIELRLDGSPIGDLQIRNNAVGMVMGMMNSGNALDDSLPVIRPGFDQNNLPANDDGSTAAVPIGFMIDFFGQQFVNTFVNNNGNITFTGPLGTFTPFDLLSTNTPIIAPFFADVDTRAGNITTFGNEIIAGQTAFGVNWPDVRHFSVNGPNQGLPENNFQLVLVDRSDLAVGDFDVEFNYEQILWEAGEASGSDPMGLGGSSARAGLSNGVDFALELPGSAINGAFLDSGPAATSLIQNSLNSMNDGRYVFFFRGGNLGAAAPSGGGGVEINASNGSDIGNLVIDGNVIDGNGSHGIEMNIQDSTLPSAQPAVVSNNEITNNGGDGFRLINPDTNGMPFEINFTDNTISENGGVGINVELNSESGGMTTALTGNTIMDNGSIGASFVTNGDSNLNLTFGNSMEAGNVVSGNVDAGIAVKTKDMSTATIVVENTMVTGTTDGPNAAFNGDGLAVHSSGDSIVTSMTVGDDMLQNTSFLANAGNGIDIELSENARNPNILIQNVVTNNNGVHGIGISRFGFSSFTEDLDSDGAIDAGEDVNTDGMLGNAVITMTSANGNGGNGLDVFVTGSQLPVQVIDVMLNQSSFSGNTIGMNFLVENNASLLVGAANNVVNGNSSHGVQVVTNQNAAFGNVFPSAGDPFSPAAEPSTFSSMVVTNNGGNGFNFVANDDSVQVIDIDDAGAVNPSTGTSATVIDSNAGNGVQITGNDNSQQNIDLIGVQITNTEGVVTGNGVDIDANDMSTVDVQIIGGINGPAIIGAAIPHVSVPGLGGPGNTVNGIDVFFQDDAIVRLDVQDVDLFNNTGDAIHIRNNGPGAGTTGMSQRQTIQATFDNVDARLSGDQGFDVILDGNIGGRPINQLADTDLPVLIDIRNSTFSSSVNEGIFFRADPGFTHPGLPAYTDQNVIFNVIDSFVQSNGSSSIRDGLVMQIGTNAYVLAEVSGTMFGANGQDDFHTRAFDSGPNANQAQLDLIFQNNSGDHIRPTALFFTPPFDPSANAMVDPAPIGTAIFVLDNAFTVEPNNNFQMFGVPQQEVIGPDGFGTNGYILRPGSNHGNPINPP